MTPSQKKIVIITGGSSGIGKATKTLLRSKGHTVYNLDISPDPEDPAAYFLACDVRKRAQIKSAIDQVIQQEKQID